MKIHNENTYVRMINELIIEYTEEKDMCIDELFKVLERKCRNEMELMKELNRW